MPVSTNASANRIWWVPVRIARKVTPAGKLTATRRQEFATATFSEYSTTIRW
jgi:hypothetical protein